jgi:hypothetical protein
VTLISPVNLSDKDKLEVLGRLDQFRVWCSLDEKRYCLACGRIITGRQIQVIGGTRGNGPLRITCPTTRCNSIPMDWVLPTSEVLANFASQEIERSRGSGRHFDYDAGKKSITSPFRKLIARLRQFA